MRQTGTLMLAAWASAALAAGQSQKDQIISLQRDVAQLEEEVKQLQKSQDEKLDAIQKSVQQALDASNKASAASANLSQSIASALADQLKKLDPLTNQLVDIRNRTNQASEDTGAMRETVTDLARRVNAMESKLSDILTQLQLLAHPPAPPPQANAAGGGAPGGFSCIGAFQSARSGYAEGNDTRAMQEFLDVVKNCPSDENAPLSMYYVGMIYDKSGEYDEAAQAFDRVVEQFSENPKTCESRYRKGDELKKAGRKTEAVAALKDYLKACPGDADHWADANKDLRALAPPPATRGAKKK
ncbi:MAG TPA: tetratricopeptide repeat protein [Bryobacteraceae bacterium]|nr:tetratricopeptide repeat protein [Bryobacteraceae bacterium]